MKGQKRRLAAVMFTDIVGYSAMMQKDELLTNRLRLRHREVFIRLTKQFGGKILQYYGDGTLSIFKSAAAAVECGVALQLELKRHPKVPLRIGIHTGDITYDKNGAYGDGMNIAARIEAACIPGGVFISGKVYDDIKNHHKLTATSLGDFDLKNIQQPIEVFAVTNDGVTTPGQNIIAVKKATKQATVTTSKLRGKKNKFVAGGLAIPFGLFGAHRFYLGQKKLGAIYLAFTMCALFLVDGMSELIPVIAIISFIDGILLLVKPKTDFDQKYNPHLAEPVQETAVALSPPEEDESSIFLKREFEYYRTQARKAYLDKDYDRAITNGLKATEIKYDEAEIHFILACCYSIIEEADKSISHLDAAVAFGYRNYKSIKKHGDLAYLRVQPVYDDFAANDFRLPAQEPDGLEEEDSLEIVPNIGATPMPDLLEQLNKLKQLRDNGILTEEEFLQQQEKLKNQ